MTIINLYTEEVGTEVVKDMQKQVLYLTPVFCLMYRK